MKNVRLDWVRFPNGDVFLETSSLYLAQPTLRLGRVCPAPDATGDVARWWWINFLVGKQGFVASEQEACDCLIESAREMGWEYPE